MPDARLHALAAALAAAPAVPDADLLRRYADRRDPAAFELLVRRHTELVWAACRSVLPNDRQSAEDAFQAAFVALARRAGSVTGPSAAGWLFRVARNAAARVRTLRAAPLPDDLPGVLPHDPMEAAESRRIVGEEVERLDASHREPVLLCLLAGHTHAEAAARLGWPVGTVASRLARAKERLRDRLTRRGVAPAVLAGGLFTLADSASAAAVRAAIAGDVSEAVRSLSSQVLSTMSVTKTKLLVASGVLAVLLAGTAAAVAFGPALRGDDPPKVKAPELGGKEKPKPKADDDLKALHGVWQVVKIENELGDAPADVLKGMSWKIDGAAVSARNEMKEERVPAFTFTLDTTTSPKQIEMISTAKDDPNKGQKIAGIYELKDDRLTICVAEPKQDRPTEFKAAKNKASIIALEKVPEAGKPDAGPKVGAKALVEAARAVYEQQTNADCDGMGRWSLKLAEAEAADADTADGRATAFKAHLDRMKEEHRRVGVRAANGVATAAQAAVMRYYVAEAEALLAARGK